MPTIRTDNRFSRAFAFAGCSLATTAAVSGLAANPAAGSMLSAKPAFASNRDAAPVRSPELLTSGERGAAVKQLQRALHVAANGVFGTATQRALVRFQRSHGLPADGVAGPATRRALHLHVRVVRSQSSGPASTGTGGYSIPASIVMCESGGDYRAVNASTGAGGAYQILPSTWAAYGGTGLPQDASPAEQNAIAARIYARGGASQWAC